MGGWGGAGRALCMRGGRPKGGACYVRGLPLRTVRPRRAGKLAGREARPHHNP